MEIAFSNKELRTICEDDTEASGRYGDEVAAGLRKRLADLRAVSSVAEIIVGNLRSHSDSKSDCKVLDLSAGAQLIFCSNHPKSPLTSAGEIDWTKVSRIKIVEVIVQ